MKSLFPSETGAPSLAKEPSQPIAAHTVSSHCLETTSRNDLCVRKHDIAKVLHRERSSPAPAWLIILLFTVPRYLIVIEA